MREAVVVASSRTALTKSFRGSFNITRPDELAAHCIKDTLRKTPNLDPNEIEDVVLGCAQPHGPQGHNIARIAAMLAGLPANAGPRPRPGRAASVSITRTAHRHSS